MRTVLSSALILLAVYPTLVLGQAPPPLLPAGPPTESNQYRRPSKGGPFGLADQAIDDVAIGIGEFQKCFLVEATLEKEVSAKKQELRQKYGGTIPASYMAFITMKSARVSKQHELCNKMVNGELFDRAANALRGVEPKSIPGFQERRDRIADLRRKFNDILRIHKTAGQPAPKQPPAEE